jgi:murein L,D-transpeptidase YcbB/YkuD
LRSAVTYLVLNPTWTIPSSIAKKEIIPEIVKNKYYIKKEHLRVLSSNGNEIDPSTIHWRQYRNKTFPYTLRQDPGKDNSLGLIKFIFPNLYQVYLHDTPSKILFDRTKRAFSHGCIRTQNPLELGKLLIANDIGNPIHSANFDQILASGKTTTVPLIQPLPIFLLYWTTSIHDHDVWFKPDLYSRNQDVQVALDGPPSPLERQAMLVPETKGQMPPPVEQTTSQIY